MGRFGWIAALMMAGLGFFVGRGLAPSAIAFPDPEAGRSAEQMESEVAQALRESRAFPRASSLIRLFEGLTTENVEGAARAVRARSGERDPVDLQLFLTAWAHLDARAAMLEVQSWPIRSRRELGIRIVMREWAASGRALEAGNYYESLSDPDQRVLAAGPLVRGWVLGGDLEGALELARRFWESEPRIDVVEALLQGTLHRESAEGVLALARQLDPQAGGEFDQRIALTALRLAGRENPVATAAYYDELARNGPSPWLAGNLVRIAGLLRNADPEAALEWLLPKPESAERSRALTETTGTWARRDLDAAWKWFEAHSSVDRDGNEPLSTTDSFMLVGLVRRMARTRPAEAAGWAVRLRPESGRIAMLRRVAYFWSASDPTAADRWLAGLELKDAERARIDDAARWGRSQKGDPKSAPGDL